MVLTDFPLPFNVPVLVVAFERKYSSGRVISGFSFVRTNPDPPPPL
jgi:hypothetical protein